MDCRGKAYDFMSRIFIKSSRLHENFLRISLFSGLIPPKGLKLGNNFDLRIFVIFQKNMQIRSIYDD